MKGGPQQFKLQGWLPSLTDVQLLVIVPVYSRFMPAFTLAHAGGGPCSQRCMRAAAQAHL